MSAPLRPGRPVRVIVQAYKEVEARKRRILHQADEVHRLLAGASDMLARVLGDEQFLRILHEEGLATMPTRLTLRVRSIGNG